MATYVADLRRLAEFCDFGGTLNKMIRDRLVCGVNHEGIQKKLLAERDLTYDRALMIAQGFEEADKNLKEMRMQKPPMTVKQEPVYQLQQRPQDFRGKACYRCGGMNHKAEDCRFREQVCRNCQKKGHIARVCRSQSKAPTQDVKTVDREAEDDYEDLLGAVASPSGRVPPLKVQVRSR